MSPAKRCVLCGWSHFSESHAAMCRSAPIETSARHRVAGLLLFVPFSACIGVGVAPPRQTPDNDTAGEAMYFAFEHNLFDEVNLDFIKSWSVG